MLGLEFTHEQIGVWFLSPTQVTLRVVSLTPDYGPYRFHFQVSRIRIGMVAFGIRWSRHAGEDQYTSYHMRLQRVSALVKL